MPECAFYAALIEKVRSWDAYGVWKNRPDEELIRPLLKTKADRKEAEKRDYTQQDCGWVRTFYEALAFGAERSSGVQMITVLDVKPEGFGCVLIVADTQVMLHDTFRDVRKFGFADLQTLQDEGEKKLQKILSRIPKD